MGPCRDIVAELGSALRNAGLKFGVSSHRAFNWKYYTFSEEFDNFCSDYHKLYGIPHQTEAPVSYEFVLDWYARTRELVDKFSPDILGKYVQPLLKNGDRVYLFVLSNMRLDQWLCLESQISTMFDGQSQTYYSILPSAPPFARNSLLSGLFPDDFTRKFLMRELR